MANTPGAKPEYRSVDTQLLGMVIKKITGTTVSEYFQKNIWQPIGAQSQAKWNVDHVGGLEKTFCCFNATARDFARVGQLFVNNGAANIGGGPVISSGQLNVLLRLHLQPINVIVFDMSLEVLRPRDI